MVGYDEALEGIWELLAAQAPSQPPLLRFILTALGVSASVPKLEPQNPNPKP